MGNRHYVGHSERLLSNQVKVPVSSHISSARCAPSFKIALVICQDEYAEQDYFHNLNAPRRDGADLIVKLQEMDFRVLAFANLSLSELRSAVDLFSKLIDNTTHALFYYNGHALGSGDDMYLAATDSTLLPGLPIGNQVADTVSMKKNFLTTLRYIICYAHNSSSFGEVRSRISWTSATRYFAL